MHKTNNTGVIVNGGTVGTAIGQQTNNLGCTYNTTANGGGNAVGYQVSISSKFNEQLLRQ